MPWVEPIKKNTSVSPQRWLSDAGDDLLSCLMGMGWNGIFDGGMVAWPPVSAASLAASFQHLSTQTFVTQCAGLTHPIAMGHGPWE